MKVLWVTNDLLPEATSALMGAGELKGSGGWLLGLATELSAMEGVELIIMGVTSLVKDLTVVHGKHIIYYAVPAGRDNNSYDNRYEGLFHRVYRQLQPDVVHIHGTEYPYSLAALRACGADHTVVSLQGMVSVIASFYLGGFSRGEILRNITFHDIVRPGLFRQQHYMERRGVFELQLLKEAHHVIGRTSWDNAHSWAINSKACYYHCDEVLRSEFYQGDSWKYSSCIPHSIFVSQGYYPLKGLHKLIDAMGIIIRHYPDVQLRVAGWDFVSSNGSCVDSLRITTYGKIIKKRIVDNHLNGHVHFIGPQNAEMMKKEYLRCNVFVCPSCIENSPNSLGEAQILGTPTVASYVGGIPSMMRGNEESLYQYEDVEVLAKKICEIFENRLEVDKTRMMQDVAKRRHNPKQIAERMIEVYKSVLNR